MHRGPGAQLVGVGPHAGEGGDVLGQPNEKADQHKRQQQRHAPVAVQRAVHHRGARIQPQGAGRQVPAVVANVVVGEEVGVDQQRHQRRHGVERVVQDAQVKQPPGLDDVAAHGCIHKAGEQWHAPQLGVGKVRVGPGLDTAGGLEHLQRKTHHVEQTDGFQFIPALQPRGHHGPLNGQRRNQQQVVARNTPQPGAGGDKHRRKEQGHKQAAAGVLQAKKPELPGKAPQTVQALGHGPVHQPIVQGVEAVQAGAVSRGRGGGGRRHGRQKTADQGSAPAAPDRRCGGHRASMPAPAAVPSLQGGCGRLGVKKAVHASTMRTRCFDFGSKRPVPCALCRAAAQRAGPCGHCNGCKKRLWRFLQAR